MSDSSLEERYRQVQEEISVAAQRCRVGLEEPPLLVAVSKGHSIEKIRTLYDLGHRHFGESYLAEWLEKKSALPDDIQWHFIGRLQSRKARDVVGNVALIHSVDRYSLLQELIKRAIVPQKILLQIHIGEDDNKGGVLPDEAIELLDIAAKSQFLLPVGVMCITPLVQTSEDARPYFRQLYQEYMRLRTHLESHFGNVFGFTHCSMGMSSDFAVAIEEGATIVRVGSRIFGPRDYSSNKSIG